MADSRGIATKILRDMLNIGGERRVNPGEGTRSVDVMCETFTFAKLV